jgi:hypothetical protein
LQDKFKRVDFNVTDTDVTVARAEGATDTEIHDTVLIAAAFCMYNRYVDGLATLEPPDKAACQRMAVGIVELGYVKVGSINSE